jgi:hypothetical protein
MSSKLEIGCNSIARRFITSTQSSEKAASTDWISIATQIGSILIPLIQQCMEKRRNANAVAGEAKQRPFATRLAVRKRVLDHFHETEESNYAARRRFRAEGDEMIGAIMAEIENRTPQELEEAIAEANDG